MSGDTCAVTVTFAPKACGPRTATLRIVQGDQFGGMLVSITDDIALTGEGPQCPPPLLTIGPVTNGNASITTTSHAGHTTSAGTGQATKPKKPKKSRAGRP
jgi:hypothetical protein